jgi:putative exosortase-associated protein (TIGR04073 family)
MRSRILAALFVVCVLAAPVRAGTTTGRVSDAVWKLTRGVSNAVFGLPSEIVVNTVGGATAPQSTTWGAMWAEIFSGMIVGTGKGLLRTGSGLVDVATFPVPFDDNRPLLEPEFAF